MKKHIFANRFKMIGLTFLLFLVSYLLFFVPPSSIFVILGLVTSLSLVALYLVSFISSQKKNQFLAALFVLMFFLMNVLIGFNIINTLLLASFIIGLRILLK